MDSQGSAGTHELRSVARNALSGWISMVGAIGLTLVVTPFVVRALDTELYGIWSFLNGLLIYSDLLYFGLGSAIIRNVAQLRIQNDLVAISRLASVVTTIYSAIGLGCLVVFVAIRTLVPSMFGEPLSAHGAAEAEAACVLLGVQMLLVFVGSAFSGLICAYDRFDSVNVVSIAVAVLRAGATLWFVRPGHSPLVAIAAVSCGSAAIRTLALTVVAFRHARGVSVRPAAPRWPELGLLYGFGLQSFFVMFAVRLISYTDTTVIGFTLGATAVTLYSFPLTLLEQARSAVSGVTSVLLPSVTTLVAQGRVDAVQSFYIATTRLSGYIAGWLGGMAIVLGPPFLDRWLGSGFGPPVQWVLVCLAVAMFAQTMSVHGPIAFYQGLNLLRLPALVLMGEAALNLIMSLWLAPILGITGVALATLVPAMLVSTAVLPPYLCRRLNLPLRRLLIDGAGPGLVLLVATVVVVWSTGFLIASNSWVAILGRAATSVPPAILVFWLTFPADQRNTILQLVRLKRA